MPVHSPYESLLAAVPVRDGEVSVLGSTTRYWDYGPSDAAVTIIVAHGYRGEHHGLEPVIAHLDGVRVIGPDMPGFGESTPLTEVEHSVAGYAAWLAGFVDALGLRGSAVILGHSFGSIVAAVAVADGLATPRLILINPIATSALAGPNAFMTRVTVLFYRAASVLPESWANRLLSSWLMVRFMSVTMTKTRNPQLRRWIHDQHHTYFSRYSDRRTVVEAFNASISTNVGVVASRIDVPVLLLAADRDPITKVKDLHLLLARFAHARLHILHRVGHLIHYELPREAATEIIDFLGVGRVLGAPR